MKRGGLALAFVVASITACGRGPARGWTGSGQEVHINAREYSFSGPSRITGGIVSLRVVNSGEEPHQAAFYRLGRKVTVEQALDAFKRDESGGAAGKLMSPVGGANTVLPGRSQRLALRLPAGSYALFCFVRGADGQLHAQRGMVAGLAVRGGGMRTAVPHSSGSVVLRDTGIDIPPALSAFRATIRVRNEGTRLHEMAFLRFPAGRTVADLVTWLTALSQGASAGPAPFLEGGGVTALPPKAEAWVGTEFDSGPHVAVSFAAGPDGRADALGGLLAPFVVGG